LTRLEDLSICINPKIELHRVREVDRSSSTIIQRYSKLIVVPNLMEAISPFMYPFLSHTFREAGYSPLWLSTPPLFDCLMSISPFDPLLLLFSEARSDKGSKMVKVSPL